MAFAIKRRGGQNCADLLGQCGIRPRRLGTAALEDSELPSERALMVEARTRQLPFACHTSHAIDPFGGGRRGATHDFDLPQAKGRPASMRWIFSLSSSLLILRSATRDFSRCVSSFSTSVSRAFRFASPPARNCSRQPESVAAVTPSSRESDSISSPRRSRRTAAVLRFADHRPRPSRRSSGAPPVALRAPSGAPEAGSLSLLTDTSMCDFSPIFTTIRCPRKPWGAGYFVQFLRRGTVSMATPTPDGQHPIYIEVSASFGASGSPVFTQDSRNAIGIVSSTLLLPGGLPLPAGVLEVIPGERINKFLHDGGVHGY